MTGQNEIIIKPERIPGEPKIPDVGIFCPNPGDAAFLMEKTKEAGGRRQFLFNSRLHLVPPGSGTREIFVAGPAVGAPMAAMTLEKLIALGCRKVIVWGWCGALVPTLRVGDLVLPTAGISDEGTSRHYPVPDHHGDDAVWRQLMQAHLLAGGWQYREGAIWSTDAPYRETRAMVNDYVGRGALGVDMEYTALAAVAAFRGIDLAALLIVSDELWGPVWRPGFQRRELKRKSRLVAEGLFSWLRQFNGESV
jgi:uridine phosphorylase